MRARSPDEKLLTVREVRDVYGIPRSTLYRYIRKGKVRVFRRGVGRETYVPKADVDALQQFHPQNQGDSGKSIWDEMREFRRRVFTGRVLTTTSAEIIEEERRKRDEEKGW